MIIFKIITLYYLYHNSKTIYKDYFYPYILKIYTTLFFSMMIQMNHL